MNARLNGDLVRWRLRDLPAKQVDMARAIGISDAYVNQLISGARTCPPRRLREIARFLDMDHRLLVAPECEMADAA